MALAAIELLMSFTFLGYLHIEPISITFAYIPVEIAARFLGIWQAAAIGAIFGLSSMFKASAYYVMPLDRFDVFSGSKQACYQQYRCLSFLLSTEYAGCV